MHPDRDTERITANVTYKKACRSMCAVMGTTVRGTCHYISGQHVKLDGRTDCRVCLC